MNLDFKKYQNYFYTLLSFLFFVSIFIFLNVKNQLPAKDNKKNEAQQPAVAKKETVDLTLNNFDSQNSLLFAQDKKLFTYDQKTQTVNSLFPDLQIEFFGILADGRVYFWQQENELFQYLFVQNGTKFDKYYLSNQSNSEKPPAVATDGSFVLLSKNEKSEEGTEYTELFYYDLAKLEMRKVKTNFKIKILNPIISNDKHFLAFAYEEQKQNKLGLVLTDSDTLNLYPKIEVSGTNLFFSPDSKAIIFNSPNGVAVFDLLQGKISDEIKENVSLQNFTQDNLLLMQTKDLKEEADFLKNCPNEQKQNLSMHFNYIYELKNSSLKKIALWEKENTLLNFVSYTPMISKEQKIPVNFQDQDHCLQTQGFWDFKNNKILPLVPEQKEKPVTEGE